MNSNETPRPLNLGEILDKTVQLYRGRFFVYLGIAIIPTAVMLILGGGIFLGLAWLGARAGTVAPITSATAMAIGFAAIGLISLPVLAVMLGVSSLSTAAMNHATANALAGGRPTIRGSFGEAWRRGWRYLWLYIVQALVVWVAPLAVWLIAFAVLGALVGAASLFRGNPTGGALIGLMTFVGLAIVAGYALWMLLCTSLAFPGSVVEKLGAWKAVRRSFRLSKGTRGRIFVLYLLGAALGWIVSVVAMVILLIGAALIPAMNNPQKAQAMGVTMVFLIYGSSFAVQAFTKPVYGIALMLFYYDQRIRNEGFDIEWMMERAGLMPGAVAASGLAAAGASEEAVMAVSNDLISVPVGMEAAAEDEASGAAQTMVATEGPERTRATMEETETGKHENGAQ